MGQRILTAVILIALALTLFFSQSLWALWVVASLVFFVAIRELKEISSSTITAYLGSLLLPVPLLSKILFHSNSLVITLLAVFAALSVAVVGVLWRYPSVGNASLRAAFLSVYIVGGLISPLLLGRHWGIAWSVHPALLLIFVPVWAADSAGYFVGKAFGKHLLAPTVSPKKTVEGAVGNLLMAILAGIGVAAWCQIPLGGGALIGALIGVFGQIGDLFESQLKRNAKLKDSGSLLPGHGGILDRIDSLLLTAPITCLVLALLAR